ncbi:hypothetical protein [Rhodopirellula sp. P2]|uniref:hypothetical protein n=1 Tax=Rhodopirellula sp. P2 TaxID=2127060 RepID=UPI0023675529|nr:hypothetical protein [Rhodopirellula sp. P2]WDQ16958.1 hypothetical protein PSR62_00030 [Rhodopirellula sp. P2]
MKRPSSKHSYLKRLSPEFYRGDACVHWSLVIQDRKRGWCKPTLLYKFRELLTHTVFRYAIACPVYCLMPDHIHMLWMGLFESSDQRLGMRHFRDRLNDVLERLQVELQGQAYDDVLQDEERKEQSIEAVCDYIARNPERAGLVPIDGYADYKFTGCLVPGYPELTPFAADYWPRYWRIVSYLRSNGLQRGS